MGLFLAVVFCRVAAAGDRHLRTTSLSSRHTHEFGLLG